MKIRRGIFETNSSSSHTLVFVPNEKLDQNIKPKQGVVDIMTGEYGWEWESYYSPEEKASYVATAIMNEYDEVDQGLVARFQRVIKEHTGADIVRIMPVSGLQILKSQKDIIKNFASQGLPVPASTLEEMIDKQLESDDVHWGYIDHQSAPHGRPDVWNPILEDDGTMKEFIFSSKCYFKTGNDNG